jgi:hypothetical protein
MIRSISASKFSGACSKNQTFASFIVIQEGRKKPNQERVVIWCLTNECLHYIHPAIQYRDNQPPLWLHKWVPAFTDFQKYKCERKNFMWNSDSLLFLFWELSWLKNNLLSSCSGQYLSIVMDLTIYAGTKCKNKHILSTFTA